VEERSLRFGRFRALPGLLGRAPSWVAIVAGPLLIALGLLLLLRPLTSLWLLAVYAGTSCIVAGISEIARPAATPRRWHVVAGLGWILVGAAILIWLGFSIAVLPVILAIVFIAGGLLELPRLREGRLSQRVLIGAWGLAQVAFGILALAWPDVTLVMIAIAFGVRTVVLGGITLGRGIARLREHRRAGGPVVQPSVARLRLADTTRWVAAVLVVLLAGGTWWVSALLRDGLPVIDSFYSAPAEVPDQPGALIRADAWPGAAPEGASVTRILYTTTDLNDQPAIASAVVIVPDERAPGPAPVILWDHGTTGIAQNCAPSLLPNMFQKQGPPALTEAIQQGWVVVATDYSGQGTAGNFPYLIGQGEARSALDSMRAARQIEGLDLSEQAVVWGHSQGGHAALWTGAIAGDYAPEIELLGVAAISPAADPLGLAELVTSDPTSAMSTLATAWVLIPYSEAYSDVDYAAHVAPSARALVREMSARCTSQPGLLVSVLTSLGIASTDRVFLGDLTSGQLGARLAENQTLGPWTMPILMAWGTADEVIAPKLQDRYVAALCAADVDVTWHSYEGYGHMTIVQDGSDFLAPLVAWTAERLAGTPPPPSDC
jgi:pimeloyl-ACP methyl ester carboxylesterase/uncharacterized membrane protein HdeD (DUF308 family)